MKWDRACAFGLAIVLAMVAASAQAKVCPVETPGFSVELTTAAYTVLFEGQTVLAISGEDLLHTIFGGKTPPVDCAIVRSTPCFMAIIVGWKLDNLLGFGPIYDPAAYMKINAMRWFPHDGTFGPVAAASRELNIIFGREHDLQMRVCWNQAGDGKWQFSSNYRGVAAAPPCDTANLVGASQKIEKTRIKSLGPDSCTPLISLQYRVGPG